MIFSHYVYQYYIKLLYLCQAIKAETVKVILAMCLPGHLGYFGGMKWRKAFIHQG